MRKHMLFPFIRPETSSLTFGRWMHLTPQNKFLLDVYALIIFSLTQMMSHRAVVQESKHTSRTRSPPFTFPDCRSKTALLFRLSTSNHTTSLAPSQTHNAHHAQKRNSDDSSHNSKISNFAIRARRSPIRM